MNSGRPAVNGEGAEGAIQPFEVTARDLKADQFADAGNMVPFPPDWPRTRRPTPEEWARIQAARRVNEDQMEGKVA